MDQALSPAKPLQHSLSAMASVRVKLYSADQILDWLPGALGDQGLTSSGQANLAALKDQAFWGLADCPEWLVPLAPPAPRTTKKARKQQRQRKIRGKGWKKTPAEQKANQRRKQKVKWAALGPIVGKHKEKEEKQKRNSKQQEKRQAKKKAEEEKKKAPLEALWEKAAAAAQRWKE